MILQENGVALNFQLARLIDEAYFEEVKISGKKLEGYSAFNLTLYRKGVHYLNSSLLLFRHGHLDAAYSCSRSVLEHIWKLYFLQLCTPQEGEFWMKSDLDPIPPADFDTIKKKYFFFSPKYLRGYLYSTNLSSMEKIYKVLCQKSHSSASGASNDSGFSKDTVKDLAKLLPMMSVGLLLAGLEIHPNYSRISQDHSFDDYFNEVGEGIGYLPDLVPDKPEFQTRLKTAKITRP